MRSVGYAEIHQTAEKTTTVRITREGRHALMKHWYELMHLRTKLELRLRDLRAPRGECGIGSASAESLWEKRCHEALGEKE